MTSSAPSGTLAPLEPGTVTLVGGGPGDPGLVTVAGLAALRQADVVLVDHLAPQDSLAEVSESCEVVWVGKLPRGEFVPQERINELLVEHARAGCRVVRFKGGDNFVFGRGGEEWQACAAAGVAVRVVPGVTSSVAAPALAGIPVTHRSLVQGFTVVSGHVPPGDERSSLDWQALARTRTTLVVLMGVKYLPEIIEALVSGGLDPRTPAAVVASAGTPGMRTIRGQLDGIVALAADVRPPAVTVIGEVAGLELDAVEA
ncbi:uroporphyrinogen-III C-methyltransferase [Luteococcus sp.]|uniref:uroporphyrinogen-III C-methyltransferase n=1 Tax=Luteococcus sp. TaxID=1969402 RepID=UPI003736CD5D